MRKLEDGGGLHVVNIHVIWEPCHQEITNTNIPPSFYPALAAWDNVEVNAKVQLSNSKGADIVIIWMHNLHTDQGHLV